MRRIRVAHIITRLCAGGAQENTFHTVRLANHERFEVDLVSGPTLGHEGSIEDRVRAADIDIIREPHLVRDVAPFRDLKAYGNLIRFLREGHYDIVHTHTSKAGYIGRMAAARADVPIVVHTPHGHIFHGYFTRLVTGVFNAMERQAARRTDAFIALTERGIDEHLSHGIGRRDQWRAIFSGIDVSPYDDALRRRAETRAELGVGDDEILVGGVGRLEPVKGFAYFVQAAARIAEAVPHARFVLAGDGALATELRAQADPLGDRLRFLGFRTDIAELMAAMDIFILPSLNEGMGRVLLECGAAGTPAVATAVGGVPDTLDDGSTGLLVPARDPDAIADAAIALAGDPTRREEMGRNARAKVIPDYGLERMVERIEALYEHLIKEKSLDG
ncbi:MAG: glycosyltransferase family 4 protein [bacterium]|nr:glycosyltransferase family 4 protein [bacterium]